MGAGIFLIPGPVDPVVADPVRQDNGKRNNIQFSRIVYFRKKNTEGGDNPSQYSYRFLSLSCLGPRQLCLPVAEFHAERMLHQWTPKSTMQISAQQTQGLRGLVSVSWDSWRRCDRQRTLVIRIAVITLASNSAITVARLRPSKQTLIRNVPKCDDDNWEPHLVDHQMLHLKPLFHFTIQKR